eukprot:gb/GEZN01022453.1/.p1 GENE.gb/GEZN01022453.1/~~gb/GEZN01022453.1/.p1  ORF type:complete len:100 (-),score=15.14 gb/GEZN01022453.1/:92-391(-)
MVAEVILSKNQRNRKKFLTVVSGIETTGLNPKVVAKKFSKKFACSSAVTKGAQGETEIQLQGDMMQDVAEFIVTELQVDKTRIFFAGKGAKKQRVFPDK